MNLFCNAGDEHTPELAAVAHGDVDGTNKGSSGRHHNSSANPSGSQQNEDGYAAGTAELLNKRVLDGKIDKLIVVAAPCTFGEFRKRYQKALLAVLVGEISKDLNGHFVGDIEKSIAAA